VGVTQLHVIHAGTIAIDKGVVFTPGIDEGVMIDIPVPVYLLRTDAGEVVLVDTGMHPGHVDDPYHGFGEEAASVILPKMRAEDRLDARLGELGLGVEDVTHVINTHLHADHCGSNFLFPQAEFIVQREHWDEAVAHPQIPSELFDLPELRYRLLDGDAEPFDGVRLVVAPGHARGFQAVVVSLPRTGTIVIAGDAIDTAEHLERDIWTHCPEPDIARASAQRLVRLAEDEHAALWFGHDAAQWSTLRLSPQGYD
jgi:N-acyl homoserine lactone hydrolase